MLQTTFDLPDGYRHGIEIRGELRDWRVIERQFVCRHCGAPLGAPFINPETGRIDHDVKTCHGRVRHVILAERDVVAKGRTDWEEHQAAERSAIARRELGLDPATGTDVTDALYGDVSDLD